MRKASQFKGLRLAPLAAFFLMVAFLAYSSTMKIEAVYSSETPLDCKRILDYKMSHHVTKFYVSCSLLTGGSFAGGKAAGT
jgi:hypothetical protein